MSRRRDEAYEARQNLNDPRRPDNMEARRSLIERVEAGDLTLEAAQKELRRLKRQPWKDAP